MPPELIDVLKTAGPVATLLAVIGWWGLNKKWVFGWLYEQERVRHQQEKDELRAEVERWQNMAIDLAGMADYASRQAVKAVDRHARPPAARRVRTAPDVEKDP